MTLWSNLHGSFLFGIALFAPFAAEAIFTETIDKWRAAQASTRGRGVLRSLFAFATERGFRVGVPTNPTIVHIGTDQPEISPAKVARSGLQRLNP